ncbi:GtrA family protein [Georgenia sp. MJ170]|uniref:GtrA family protein n=1 Tax=Georgenia sunbinii TaxID=3117728 RepID=UPI002F26950B
MTSSQGVTGPEAEAAAAITARAATDGRLLRWRQQAVELMKFGTVGAIAFVVDVGLMNLLRFGPGEVLGDKALTAKVISVAVATMVAWLGNRHWTFSDKKRDSRSRELIWFLLVNAGGMLIAVGALGVSHYVLGFQSALADNIAANVVGLGLGTAFRYFCYRYLVFNGRGDAGSSH